MIHVKGGFLQYLGNVNITDNFVEETYKRLVDWNEQKFGKTLTEKQKNVCM